MIEKHRKDLANLFERDHARLLELLSDVRRRCELGSYLTAAKIFGEFRILEEHHLNSEGQVLDVLIAGGACPPALAQQIASEHVSLKKHMEAAWTAISGGDHQGFGVCINVLIEAVDAHERTEKEVLLPAIHDPLLLDSKGDDLVKR